LTLALKTTVEDYTGTSSPYSDIYNNRCSEIDAKKYSVAMVVAKVGQYQEMENLLQRRSGT
jgi:hypothetical protein